MQNCLKIVRKNPGPRQSVEHLQKGRDSQENKPRSARPNLQQLINKVDVFNPMALDERRSFVKVKRKAITKELVQG